MEKNKYIDHTLLKPEATREQIIKLCEEAKEYNFASVCVNPFWVSLCKEQLKGTDVKVCTVVGFPLGATTSQVKSFETQQAINNGADEIDMVINIGMLKDKQYQYVTEEIRRIVNIAGGKCVKVIFETCLLTNEEIVKACECSMTAGATFVKTSTGFSKAGATLEAVKLMVDTVAGKCKVKASGGIRTPEDFEKMITLGAERIGTSSGVAIIKE